jgi:hypothetical protein
MLPEIRAAWVSTHEDGDQRVAILVRATIIERNRSFIHSLENGTACSGLRVVRTRIIGSLWRSSLMAKISFGLDEIVLSLARRGDADVEPVAESCETVFGFLCHA